MRNLTSIMAAVLAGATLVGCQHDVVEPPTAPPNMNLLEKTHLTGPRVIRKQLPRDLNESGRFVLQGTRTSSGACTLRRRVTLKRGDRFTETVAEVDMDTCEYLLVRSDYRMPMQEGLTTHRVPATVITHSERATPVARAADTGIYQAMLRVQY